jgi:prepilin-type N-terminal cleavage/methylation domain-containing protein
VTRRAGFTLVETAVAIVVVSLLVLIGFPKVSGAMAKNDVRAARTTVVNLLAKARAAATETNRLTWLKLSGNQAWILARPRRAPGAGDADTIGIVENLNTRYGTTMVTAPAGLDSIGYDPRGIASGLNGVAVTITLSRQGHTDVVTIDGMGRVVK